MFRKVTLAGIATLFATTAFSQGYYPRPEHRPVARETAFERTVDKVASMLEWESQAKKLAERYKLDVMATAWEDNGRDKNSSVGSLYSDLSILVHIKDRSGNFKRAQALPILRHQNF